MNAARSRVRKQLARAKVLEFFRAAAAMPDRDRGVQQRPLLGPRAHQAGHTVKLMAAQFVIPYRKRGKNDANDAEAICEAVGRPNMRFVAIKSEEQQSVLMVHRARTLVVANRTAQVNQIRGLLGEFGLVVPKGVARLRRELPGILEDAENGLPALAREVLAGLLEQFHEFDARVSAYDRQIRALAAASEPARRLMQVEAIGPQTATALVASMGDPHVFKSGRGYAASLGITPRQHSSGGKERLGQITRQGDQLLANAPGARRASVPARRRQEDRCQERLGATAEGAPPRERRRRRARRQACTHRLGDPRPWHRISTRGPGGGRGLT